MTKPHKSEALTGDAVIETYAVHSLKFEERFEDYHEIKFPITDNHEAYEIFKLECDMCCSTLFNLELQNKHDWKTSCELKH